MNIVRITRSVLRVAREDGLLHAVRHLAARARIRFRETRLGIQTEASIELSELGILDRDSRAYQATEYASFDEIMRQLNVDPREHVFFDYGAGMGRAMVLAATYPFRRVLGVEISAQLAEIATRNFAASRARVRCQDISIAIADASHYILPADVSVLYFNNPFGGLVLKAVLAHVRQFAMRAGPRTPLMVCNLPRHSEFAAEIRLQSWLELSMEFDLPNGRRCLILWPRPA